MPILAPSPENLARAAARLRDGGLVAFPTETVYGLGADATSAAAAALIFEAKRRPRFDPLIVHLASADLLPEVAREVPDAALALAREFWPGPLTLVLARGPRIPELVAAELPTVAVRVPAHPVAQALLAAAGVPVAAPSANPFGYLSPTTARHVEEQLGERVELILDGGPSAFGVESTIVDLSGPVPALLRAGALERERIEAVTGPLERRTTPGGAPVAPGQLPSHYAPRIRLVRVPRPAQPAPAGVRAALLCLRAPPPAIAASYAAVRALSASGSLREAAAGLFAALHELDALELDVIFAERVPAEGLGLAIEDRLDRAAAARAAGEGARGLRPGPRLARR